MSLIPKNISDKVLSIGEYLDDSAHGGIASVLLSYRENFESFKFLPSFRSKSLLHKLRYDLGSLLRLSLTLLKDREIRIVHIHTAAGRSFTKHLRYAFISRKLGRKVIMHCHASSFKLWYEGLNAASKRRIVRKINALDRFIVLSLSWKEYFERIGVDPARIEILNNLIPLPSKALEKSAEGEPARLLFLGEIGPRKGVFDLLEAIRGEAGEGLRLDIGGNRMETELKERIAALGLCHAVTFHGFVSGEAKAELLARADVFVLPSYNEGLPISILEAMSYGCAIISTSVGGIPEVVKGNGLLVAPGDIAAIGEAVSKMKDASLRRKMGAMSLEMVGEYYPGPVLARLSEIYSSLCGQR